MANQPYFPGREGDQLTFLTNLQSKIAAYYTALDISAARQPKLQLTLAWLIWAWQSYLPARRQDAPAATSWRNLLATGTSDATTVTAPPAPAVLTPPAGTAYFGMLTWLFEEIGRWKTAEGYTDTIGQNLGVIGAAATAHTDPPVLSQGPVAQNNVQLDFTLYEHDGLWLENQVQGSAGFTFLATDTASPLQRHPPGEDPRPGRVARLPRLLVGQRHRQHGLRAGAPRAGAGVGKTILSLPRFSLGARGKHRIQI